MRMVQAPFVRILLSPRPTWVVSVGFFHISSYIAPGDGAQDPETQTDHHNTSRHRSCSFRRVRTRTRKPLHPSVRAKTVRGRPGTGNAVIVTCKNFPLFPL